MIVTPTFSSAVAGHRHLRGAGCHRGRRVISLQLPMHAPDFNLS